LVFCKKTQSRKGKGRIPGEWERVLFSFEKKITIERLEIAILILWTVYATSMETAQSVKNSKLLVFLNT
jgi:hypothetical protein